MGGPAQPRRVADPNAPPQQGMIYPGRVSNVMDFGCFVQLEGCKGRAEGLVHISLISQGQLRTPHDAVTRGQPCFVKVLSCTGSQITPTPTPSPTLNPNPSPSPSPSPNPSPGPSPGPSPEQVLSCTGSKMSLSMRDADQTSGADLNPSMRLPGQATNQLQPLSNPTRDEGAGEKRRREI